MSFFAVRIYISSQDDEVDSWLRAQKLDDLSEAPSNLKVLSADVCVLESELEGDHAVAAVVSYPEHLEPGIVVHMAEHVRIFVVTTDELDGAENIRAHSGQKLEDRSVLTADDEPTIDEGKRRGNIFTPNLRRPNRELAVDIPKGQGGVFGDGGDRGMVDIEFEGDERL